MRLKLQYELGLVHAIRAPARCPPELYYNVSSPGRQLSSSIFNGGGRCTGQAGQNVDPKHKVGINV